MMKYLSVIALFMMSFCACSAQEEPSDQVLAEVVNDGEIRWLSFEEAVSLSEQTPKKLFIDVYTDWCGWCKRMDKTTFSDPDVAREINRHFYPVKLDAERKDTVRFRENVFVYRAEYKAHELALSLLNGKMGYPTYVFLDDGFGMISPVSGFKSVDDMLPLLSYYGGDVYKTTPWEEYLAGVRSPGN